MVIEIKGKVIPGKEHGRTIGFPTANIVLEKDKVFDGTYKVNIIVDGKIYHGVGNARNSFGLFETHIFDFNEDIYEKEIEVIIGPKIRDNIKFDSLLELKKQIEKDVDYAKKNKTYVLTFGTFDLVHEGHRYFLQTAKKYGDILVTILATDKSIEKFKHVKPMFDIETRKKQIQDLGVCDIIGVGDENNPLKWIEMYSPAIVCLGYDQIGYSKELKEYKEKYGNIEVIRLAAYNDEKYKSSIIKEKIKKNSK